MSPACFYKQSQGITEKLWLPIFSCCHSHLRSQSHTWSRQQLRQNQTHVDSGKEELQEKFWHLSSLSMGYSPQPHLLEHPLYGVLPLYLSAPWDTRTHQQVEEAVFLPGSMALCSVIVIQSFLSGAENATVQKRVWKPLLSFIVSRLKSFLTTSENKQLSGYWSSLAKGRKHMFTVRLSPWRKHWQPFKPAFPGKRAQMFLLEQNHHILLRTFSFQVSFISF